MLTWKQRAKITVYCMRKLYPLCVRRKNLFTDKDAEDLVEELGVHIWVALTSRYRKKPYDQALRLAMTTGINRLKSIVRTRMTVVKRGAGTTSIPYYGVQQSRRSGGKKRLVDNYALVSTDVTLNGVQLIDTLEAIVSAAITRVGSPQKAKALVKALLFDWRKKKLVPTQRKLMATLKRDRKGVRRLVSRFTEDIRKQGRGSESATYDNLLQKVEGKWKKPV